MSDNNVVKHNFKSYKKTRSARRKFHIRLIAIIGTILMISGVVGSILYYI